ncbi:glycosyltransferase family 2 protein [Reyranella sp.]|uniref:glycosyltransferase family 2 protein n=1 Tax=Reyranella sp. TaxID=1929291 RepID=UPI003BAB10F6
MSGHVPLEVAVKAPNERLVLTALDESRKGRWLQLRYRMTLYGSAGRPVVRFCQDGEETQEFMSAALFGGGEWIGRLPRGTSHIEVAPPPGFPPAGLSLTSGRILSDRAVLTLARGRNAARAGLAAALDTVGFTTAADTLLKDIFGATPIDQYHEWRERNRRELDLAGLESPRDNWTAGPHIRVILLEEGEKAANALRATLFSLERQAYPNWSLAVAGRDQILESGHRLVRVDRNARAEALWRGLNPSDIVLPISAGDTISDYAMGALVEFASTRPTHMLFYADEDSIDAGRHVAPELKPDWSSIFQQARSFVGRALYVRCRALESHGGFSVAEMLRPSTWGALFGAQSGPVGHIRRVLLTKVWRAERAEKRVAIARRTMPAASATLIIPTRDRARLMAACLASLEKTTPRSFDLLIVDNGSTESSTRRLLGRAAKQAGVRVLDGGGPFNFSALCNEAARHAEGRVLVFLNNDTEVLRPDWLVNLAGWALQPEIGAVGAKLIYASGRLQHAGLVLGLGGYAAHIDIGTPSEYPGYLDRFTVPREVSAVTGACLAVEKSKFQAIGGFDADRFPVELGDVDLCLRLAERGWKSVITPDALLMHRESATRGRSDVARRYAAERRHFRERWMDSIRDDPFFHPALSLTARRTSLDH